MDSRRFPKPEEPPGDLLTRKTMSLPSTYARYAETIPPSARYAAHLEGVHLATTLR